MCRRRHEYRTTGPASTSTRRFNSDGIGGLPSEVIFVPSAHFSVGLSELLFRKSSLRLVYTMLVNVATDKKPIEPLRSDHGRATAEEVPRHEMSLRSSRLSRNDSQDACLTEEKTASSFHSSQ